MLQYQAEMSDIDELLSGKPYHIDYDSQTNTFNMIPTELYLYKKDFKSICKGELDEIDGTRLEELLRYANKYNRVQDAAKILEVGKIFNKNKTEFVLD